MQQIERLMRDNGFVLLRANKHCVWEKDGVRIVTAKTPSCNRAFANIKSWIKRFSEEKK